MNDSYGDIKYKPFNQSTLDGLRDTAAGTLADEIAAYRNEIYDNPVAYVSQWYEWSNERRAWMVKI